MGLVTEDRSATVNMNAEERVSRRTDQTAGPNKFWNGVVLPQRGTSVVMDGQEVAHTFGR